ncbi:uncharacterized protein LOC109835358 [Asparagus officinalis]|uniref:uncharacterized protein LOC109835358 n=1 Tax=Asparagus officinalis TaxID=4686 RepID=UPI00098E7C69|nr:uncharacterized protein LOC109835358 [Asparagus officinalis]
MSSFLAFGKDYVASNYEKTGNPVYLHIQQMKKPIPEIRPLKKPTLLAIALKLNPSLGEFIASCLSVTSWYRYHHFLNLEGGNEYNFQSIWIFDIHIPLDIQRIWKRNLGRDDRCISDHGKEARFPFLDEDVIKSLLELPLWEIAELDEPAGRGDKKILREVARLLGIEGTSLLPKRAIQFGSRIARESNRKTFGSNRVENQASAGSVEIWEK